VIDNDGRRTNHGLTIGDVVDFRRDRADHRGVVVRLTASSVVIRTGEVNSHRVAYRQVAQSTRYRA
jgi:bifunctional DNA-binding transcriptional regulator/antitoxin component of YhaV-PrlF toxin-antitoxin module